jgi:hypothetical protein
MPETVADQAERERVEAERAEQERQKKIDEDMDAEEFVVIGAYITPKVKDAMGLFQMRGYNEGGVIKAEDIDPDSLRHHLESGLMAPKDSDAARFAGPAGTPKPGEPPNVPVTEQPVVSLPLDERLRRQQAAAAETEKAESPARTPAGRQASAKAHTENSGG